jgi:hypothetical protein
MEMRLSDIDYIKIYTELKDHAAEWRDIGSTLGFR